MGNGQNRSRRGGARTRHGTHRGGAGVGDRRNATHVMPPTLVAGVDANAGTDTETQLEEAQAAENAEERIEAQAGELRGAPHATPPEPEPGVVVASAPEPPATPPATGQPPLVVESAPTRDDATEAASSAASAADVTPLTPPSQAPAQQAETAEAVASPEVERRAPRGRFERFYAPGQGARAEQNGHAGATTNGVNGAARHPVRESPSAHAPHAPHAPLAPSAAQAPDDDEAEAAPSGPREDVRGAVGGLIDSLHGLFTQDRTVASQGGSSRCGICYFHFPVGELVYREAEGFYVCQTCERALGSARVNMVRRQQRQ